MRLRDIDPASLGKQAHEHVVERIHGLLAALDPTHVSPPLDGPSEVRRAVTLLAHYARTGEPPEGRRELVHEYLVSLVPAGLLPDGDLDNIGDEPETEDRVAAAVHLVVIVVLARERLANGEPVPAAWLGALGGISSAGVRDLVRKGELRQWKRGVASDRRVYVHPEDAARWLDARKPS